MAGKDDDRGEARKFPHTTSSRIENGVIPEMAKPVTSGKLSVVFHATGGDDDSQMMRQQPPQSSSPCAPSPQNISYHVSRLLVGCCVPTSSRSHQNPRPRCSLIFFSTLKSPPKTTRKRSPHTFLPGRVSYQTPPLPTTPSFCSLLCRPNERRPSKTGAPPISNFSMGAVSVPQTRKSAVRTRACAGRLC
jgi:hypothetical protein